MRQYATRSTSYGRILLVALAAAACAGCKSAGASSGPNPNMEALNARYGVSASDPKADYVPLFLYYPDAPKPPTASSPQGPSGAIARANVRQQSGQG